MRCRLLSAGTLATALVTRLWLALLYEPPDAVGDAAELARHAQTIAETGGYPPSLVALEGGPSAFRPPGYPYFLAAVTELTGAGDGPRVIGALLGTVAVGLIGVIALRVFDRTTALVAMALAAIFPPLIMVSVAQLTEGLFIVLMLAALACVLQGPERLRWVLAAGVFAGGAALTRTNGLVILLPLVLAARGVRPRLALVAALLIVIAPWGIRNSTQFGSFVPLSTQPGFAFAGAYNDEARTDAEYPAAWRVPDMRPYIGLRRPGVDEAELDRAFLETALDYAGDHPTYPFVVVFWASARMLNVVDFDLNAASGLEAGVRKPYSRLNRLAFWILGLLALAGAFTVAVRSVPRWLWLFPALLWISVAVASGLTRYRTPIDPFLILPAAAAIAPAPRGGWSRRGAAVESQA
jgi:4-amino-4-deoxy-L-arabinose transferase-like glycosyltransferase